jgi:hypothetical protein
MERPASGDKSPEGTTADNPASPKEADDSDPLACLSTAERAELKFHEDEYEKGVDSALGHILWVQARPHLYRGYGDWDDYCRRRWGHSKNWARHLIKQAQYQDLMKKELPGFDWRRVGQLDAKELGCLDDHPDLQVRSLVIAEEDRKAKGDARKSAALFKKAVKDFAKYAHLRAVHPNLTADEILDLAKLRADVHGHVDARVLTVARELGVNVDTLLLPGGGTAGVLVTYRGERLDQLAKALVPAWEEYEKRQKADKERREAEEKERDSSGTRSTTQPKPGEDEDGDQDEDDALLPKVRITLTTWVKHEVLKHLKGGVSELWLTVYAPPEGDGPNADNELVGMLEADTWEAEEMAEEGSWPQAADGQPAAQLEGPNAGSKATPDSLRQIEEALDRAPKATLVEKLQIEMLKAVAVELQFKYGRNREQAIAEWTKRTAKMGLGDKPGEGLSESAYDESVSGLLPRCPGSS